MKLIRLTILLTLAIAVRGQSSNFFQALTCRLPGPTVQLFKATDTETNLITADTIFNATKPTFFIIHGWKGNSSQTQYPLMAQDIYFKTQGNIIMVDFKYIAQEFYLTCAYSMTYTVGDYLANFIVEQTAAKNMHPSRIHLIGHSIGAQISGYVGRQIKARLNLKIKRISALDPAGPLFSLFIINLYKIGLSATDADIVDAMHTSMVLGTVAPIGTVDFYVRGVLLGLPSFSAACGGIYVKDECNHELSNVLFRESIRSCGIVGTKFLNPSQTSIYGFNMPLDTTGIYSFVANAQAPYGSGDPVCPQAPSEII